jgi:hypothetical protein
MARRAFITRGDLRYPSASLRTGLNWKPREHWTRPRQISAEERQQREEELAQQRQQEREAWEAEKRRLGL